MPMFAILPLLQCLQPYLTATAGELRECVVNVSATAEFKAARGNYNFVQFTAFSSESLAAK